MTIKPLDDPTTLSCPPLLPLSWWTSLVLIAGIATRTLGADKASDMREFVDDLPDLSTSRRTRPAAGWPRYPMRFHPARYG